MGRVIHLPRPTAAPALPAAVEAWLAAPSARRMPLAPSTRSLYRRKMALLHTPARTGAHRTPPFAPTDTVDVLGTEDGAARLLDWFRTRFETAAATTWNTDRAVLLSACDHWTRSGWLPENPAAALEPRGTVRGAPRAHSRAEVESLIDNREIPLRERVLIALLYDSAARIDEILSLDVEDLDLENRRAAVHRKGGAQDVIMWEARTSALVRRYLGKRRTGPLFLTDRRARADLGLADVDLDKASGRARLSYRRAEAVLGQITDGWNPHDLRHSRLTHAAEDGMPVPLLLALSGHASVRSLIIYTRPRIEAVDAWESVHSPARHARTRRGR